MDRETISFILPVFGKLLYTYPDRNFLEKIKKAGLFENIPYKGDSVFSKGQEMLARWQASEDTYDNDIADYQDLFVGVRGKVKTPAWESVYVAPDPVMFGECTLDARLWYDKYGMEIKNIRHEPDDHMGIELMFLAHLTDVDPEGADSFFAGHVALWYERFFGSMAANATADLYKGAALVLYAICADIEKAICISA